MAEKSSSEVRQVICTIVHGQPETADLAHILHCFMLVLRPMFEDTMDLEAGQLPVSMILVEGRQLEVLHENENLNIVRQNIQACEHLIALYESGESMNEFKAESEEVEPAKDILTIAIGSKDFCMAFVHGMAMVSEVTCQSWGMRMLRRLANAEPGQVLVFDNDQSDTLHVDDLGEMYKQAFPERG